MLGRQSQAEKERGQRFAAWVAQRTPLAILSGGFGIMSVIDVITVVLGLALAAAAIGTGIAGLRDLRRRPHLLGRRLCFAGIALGITGGCLSLAVWWWLHRAPGAP